MAPYRARTEILSNHGKVFFAYYRGRTGHTDVKNPKNEAPPTQGHVIKPSEKWISIEGFQLLKCLEFCLQGAGNCLGEGISSLTPPPG